MDKWAITDFHLISTEAFLACLRGKHVCLHGPHLSSVSYQSSGGDEIPGVSEGDTAAVDMGLSLPALLGSGALAR